MAVKLLILQTTIRIDFGFNNQILKLLNQTYPGNYLSEYDCCGELKSTLKVELLKYVSQSTDRFYHAVTFNSLSQCIFKKKISILGRIKLHV